jgi:coenzyme F420-reducing hydrogenase beta subunit
MIDSIPIEFCVGCHACESVCTEAAIEMTFNNEGFLYPQLDSKKCTRCGKCLSVCPAINEVKLERLPTPDVYAAWSNRDEILKSSSSGGIFTELALKILDDNGAVFGAAFDTNLKLLHTEIDTKDDLPLLRGSKYLQSNLADVFKKIKHRLENNQKVLFVGTPCQVAGLNSFLQYDYSILLTCDLICHGVAPPGVFSQYVNELQEKYQAAIKNFQFRAKPYGWKNFYFDIAFDNNDKILEPFSENFYMKGFLANLYLRPTCYNCKYSRLPRVADITLGDFWGIWNYRPEWNDDRGISAVLVNSIKAQAFLLKYDFIFKPAELTWVIKGNPSLTGSAKLNKVRKKFFKLLEQGKKFEEAISICLPPPSYFDKVLWSIKRHLRRLTQ